MPIQETVFDRHSSGGRRPEGSSGARLLGREEVDISSDDIVLLRAVEVSQLLGLSRSQVYQMMADGGLPVIRIGRAIRVPKQALAEWIRANTMAPSDTKGTATHEATLEP